MLGGFYLPFSDAIDAAANRRIHALTARLLDNPMPGVTDLIPGYVNLYIEYDAGQTSEVKVRDWLETARLDLDGASAGREIELAVDYSGEDLREVASQTDLSVDEVIARHSAPLYQVFALGFTPGFPFMGEVDEALRLPRRARPRDAVPAHSVAIARAQTGIYPTVSPGGWHVLGRALERVYDPLRGEPFLLEPGDRVRFVPGEGKVPEAAGVLALLPEQPRHPLLEVLSTGLHDLVVDRGRFMSGRYGLSRSGPLDARAARLANALLGNPGDAPLLEMNLKGASFEVLDRGVLAFTGGGMRPVLNNREVDTFTSFAVQKGDRLSFEPEAVGSRGYLALAGGVESARFRGSASVDVRGGIGQPLRVGDMLGVAQVRRARPGFSFRPYSGSSTPLTLRLLPGPQASAEAFAALQSAPYEVKQADRMGLRLSGPEVPGGDVISEATPVGALQITTAGEPILLLKDRGTLGGYAKPALLDGRDLSKAAQLRPGARLRFKVQAR